MHATFVSTGHQCEKYIVASEVKASCLGRLAPTLWLTLVPSRASPRCKLGLQLMPALLPPAKMIWPQRAKRCRQSSKLAKYESTTFVSHMGSYERYF